MLTKGRSLSQLHVLEYLKNVQHSSKSQGGTSYKVTSYDFSSSTAFGRSYPAMELALTDATGREVGLGWVSAEVVAGLQRKMRASLALQCASQLLQDHPYWGGQACAAWQDPVMSQILLRQIQRTKRASSTDQHREIEDGSADSLDGEGKLLSFLEEADKNFDSDIKLLEKKYQVDVDWVVAAVCLTSQSPQLLALINSVIDNRAHDWLYSRLQCTDILAERRRVFVVWRLLSQFVLGTYFLFVSVLS